MPIDEKTITEHDLGPSALNILYMLADDKMKCGHGTCGGCGSTKKVVFYTQHKRLRPYGRCLDCLLCAVIEQALAP